MPTRRSVMIGRKKSMHHVRAALGPAQALPPQAAQRLGHQDPDEDVGFVNHLPAGELHAPGDVDILGQGARRPPAGLLERNLAEGADHAGHGEKAAVHGLGALDQADDRGELADLQAAEEARCGCGSADCRRRRRRCSGGTPRATQRSACGSSSASPSMQTRISCCASRAPALSAVALPWFSVRRTTRKRGIRLASSFSTSVVTSLLPSFTAMISKSG